MPPRRPPNSFLTNHENLQFDYFLTKELGLGTVARMEAVMSAREYLYWTRYYLVEQQNRQLEELKAKQKAKRRR